MPTLELTVLEDKLEDFQAWFREQNPRSKEPEIMSFSKIPGSNDVAFKVRTTVQTEGAAALVKSTWG
jgi:hypothetical protein